MWIVLRSPGRDTHGVRLPALLGVRESLLALLVVVQVAEILDLLMSGIDGLDEVLVGLLGCELG